MKNKKEETVKKVRLPGRFTRWVRDVLRSACSGLNRISPFAFIPHPSERSESGQVLFQTAIALIPLLAVVGFAVDGGLMFVGYRRAQTALDVAAHAASHTIDREHFSATQEVRLDQVQALATAQYYASLNSRGIASVDAVYLWPPDNPDRVIVVGTARIPIAFWRVIGFDDLRIRVVGTAHPTFGISEEGQ